MKKYFNKVKNAWKRYKTLRAMPLRLEFILTDYCNLNCRGCTHFSPLAAREFAPLEEVVRQMDYLGKVCGSTVKQVYLIGGETLLYPELPAAIAAARKAFPEQDILIFTNGLLLGRMSEDFWESARRNRAIIAITRYPVQFDYEAAIEKCKTEGVETLIFGDRSMADNFFRFALDAEGRQNRYISHFKCYNRGCVSVVDGYVYPCSTVACIKHLNRAKGTNFEIAEGDRLAVETITDVRQILRLRDRPTPFCRYCKNPPEVVPYGPSKRQASEWGVEEN